MTVDKSEDTIDIDADATVDVLCLALSIHEHMSDLSEKIAESVPCKGEMLTHAAYPL